jgi:ATP phosphoribosyltransferase regulatory subunit
MREFLQAGIELIGAPGPQGTAEALTVLCGALDAVGLSGYRVGLGDAALYPNLMAAFDVPEEARERMLGELGRKDLVGLEREVQELRLPADAADLLVRVPQLRGGADVLGAESEPVADAVANLRGILDLLEPNVAGRVIFDLGLARGLGYYSGAVFDVYDPALGAPLGGGGRYDDLLGRFGRDLPAVGFAIGVDRLHAALSGEEHAGL